jgi:hypothetical protein
MIRKAKFDGGVRWRRSSSQRQQASGAGNRVAKVVSGAGVFIKSSPGPHMVSGICSHQMLSDNHSNGAGRPAKAALLTPSATAFGLTEDRHG